MHSTLQSKPQISQRVRSIKRVLWGVLFLNLAVAAAKYIYGTLSGSAAMQADGIHSIFDSAGNVVGLVGLSLASRPADKGHPYGHAKFETYASIAIGLLLLLAAYEIGSTAIGNLVSGVHDITVTPTSFIVMIVTLTINLGVTRFERKRGTQLKSDILTADASHTLSDALVSIGVIIGLIFASFGFPVADSIVALVVMVVILFTAFTVFRRAFSILSDGARIPENSINDSVMKIGNVRNAHHIRTRGTESEIYVDLHVLVDPSMSVLEAHQLSDEVECVIKKSFPQVIEVLVHIEPDDGHVD